MCILGEDAILLGKKSHRGGATSETNERALLEETQSMASLLDLVAWAKTMGPKDP